MAEDKAKPAGPVEAVKQENAARQAAFEAEQKARQERFERENEAAVHKAERAQAEAERKAADDEAIRVAQEENDALALKHGWLTDADLIQRKDFAQQHLPGAYLPHQVLAEGEPTVKMVFPTHAILNTDDGKKVLIYKGYNDIPESLSDHQHLANLGAHRVGDDGKPEPAEARTKRVAEARAKREAAEAKAKPAD